MSCRPRCGRPVFAASSVCVMPTTLVRKGPFTWLNLPMNSWANSASRDLHLDLREAIAPGARGARDLLLTALRDAVRSGRLALAPCCHRRVIWRLTSDWPATPSPRRTRNWSPRAGLRPGRARARGSVNIGAEELPARPRGVSGGADAQPDARLTGRLGVPAWRMGRIHPPRTLQRADRGAAHG